METGYLSQVSSFNFAPALLIILGANLAITLIHILQEWKGEEVPLWRVLGAIAGVCVPHDYGFALFTVALLATLWLAGIAGVAGLFGCLSGVFGPSWGLWLGVAALGFIIGGRISDSIVSHWRLYARGYRPNPGLYLHHAVRGRGRVPSVGIPERPVRQPASSGDRARSRRPLVHCGPAAASHRAPEKAGVAT